MRYRKPSIKSLLGITKAKRRVKRSLGVYKVTKYTNAPKNFKTKIKRKSGYYSAPMKIFRLIKRLIK
jgi:putative lipase involved disintegration of autophagic bodies